MRFLITQIHLPFIIRYLSDYLSIILFLQIVLHFNKTKYLNIRKPLSFIILFLLIGVFSTLYNGNGLIFFIWGLRSYFRFFVFFLACTIFLKKENIDKLLKFLLILLPINFFLSLFQYQFLGLRNDNVGGTFGIEQGCNGEMNTFLTVVITITIVYYIYKKYNSFQLIANISMVVIIASISELKFTIIIIGIITFIIFILSFPNYRAIKLAIISCCIIIVGGFILLSLYPSWIDMFGTLSDAIYHTAIVYAREGSLGRLTAGPYLLQNILTEPYQKLIGIGLGNADKFLTFTSTFFNRYEDLEYNFFTYSLMLVEVGLIGLISYCLFFISILYDSLRIRKKINQDFSFYCIISFILSLMVFQLIIYNTSMYLDCSFIIFFTLSFPFIIERETIENKIILIKQ